MKWNLPTPTPLTTAQAVFKEILAKRGITKEEAVQLRKNPVSLIEWPEQIAGIHEAAKAISEAIYEKRPIYIFADYDVDGMTSGYVMTSCLEGLGATVEVYYPEREEGYGLSLSFGEKLERLELPMKPLVVTVDNGITAVEPVQYLVDRGYPVVITDHHQPADVLPNCIICDPWLDQKEGTHLAGVAVAWKVALLTEYYLEKKIGIEYDIVFDYLPFVGIGTVSDVMPMKLENRAIVAWALKQINSDKIPVFNAMKEIFGLKSITAKDIGWSIAPKFNSSSRLGDTRTAAGAFFLTEKEELEKTLVEIALSDKERKKLTDKAIKEAIEDESVQNGKVAFYNASTYPRGISGIIAANIANLYNKPAVVFVEDGNNLASASCRTANGIDIKELLNKQAEKELLDFAAGHAMACGAKLYLDKIEELKKAIDQEELIQSEATLDIDAVLSPSVINQKLLKEINSIPYNGDTPVFVIENIQVNALTPFKNQEHIVFKIPKNGSFLYAIGWSKYEQYKSLGSPEKINIAGTLEHSKFSSKSINLEYGDVVLIIEDMKVA